MAIVCNGTTHLLRSGQLATSLQTSLTIAAWIRPDAASGETSTTSLGLANSTNDNGLLGHIWGSASSGNRNKAVVGGSYVLYGTAGANAAATWMHLCLVSNGTNFYQYENGVLIGPAATGSPNGTVTSLLASVMCGVAAGNRVAGKTCMIGVWLAALTADEAKALGKGVAPHLVRPQSLRWYVPGFRSANAVIGTTATATDLTYDGDNPRIIL